MLELASGSGACTLLLSGKCPEGEVICLEASSEMIRLARRNIRSAGCKNVTLIRGDVKRLSELGPARFDFVVCNSAFWQFAEPERLLRAISEVLKPGGTLTFNLPIWHRTKRKAKEFREVIDEVLTRHGINPADYWEKRRPVDYRAILKDCGFVRVRESRYSVPLTAAARDEWRRIPAFKERRRDLRGVSRKVSDEVRVELRNRGQTGKLPRAVHHPRWRLITARNRSG